MTAGDEQLCFVTARAFGPLFLSAFLVKVRVAQRTDITIAAPGIVGQTTGGVLH